MLATVTVTLIHLSANLEGCDENSKNFQIHQSTFLHFYKVKFLYQQTHVIVSEYKFWNGLFKTWNKNWLKKGCLETEHHGPSF